MPHLLTHFLLFCAYSGVSIVLFLLLLLSKTWRKQRAQQILAGILLSFLFVVLLYVTVPLASVKVWAVLLPIGLAIPYALGPLLYFYIKLTYQPRLPLGNTFWRHMLPFLIVFTCLSLPLGWWLYTSPRMGGQYHAIVLVPIAGILLMSYYVYRCAQLLKRFQLLVKHNYSTLSKVDLRWLNLWVKGLILFVVLDALTGGLVAVFPWLGQLIYINALYLVGLIWYIGYFGLQQTQVFLSEMSTLPAPQKLPQKPTSVKAKNNATSTKLQQQLHNLILQEALYKNEDVSLYKVAQKMGLSDKRLSELINKEMGTNFYEYINSFRVDAFKERVKMAMPTLHFTSACL
ncbi:helix-turn-helix domain-containing protein [Microscilla marina]|uniref:Transcriptional regulator, AraC family, putative n=1 Tax=Microscilla marina ATCC 23134 TaxID=313606 RepID=A1ZM29_MICM2|nr:AraC family transcriptional regulator [Microscilla marina]EAY28561.1 transcriptional regulator, AraC family, putative [Microscilla marina ATCC 23134]